MVTLSQRNPIGQSKTRIKPTITPSEENLKQVNLKKMNRKIRPASGKELLSPLSLDSPIKKKEEVHTPLEKRGELEGDDPEFSRELDHEKPG